MTQAPTGVIRVYLVVDHEPVRHGLRRLLEGERGIEVVGEAASAEEATRRIPALGPHVALVGLRLGDRSGVDVSRAVRSVSPDVATIILTTYDDEEALWHALLGGAAGALFHRARGGEVVDAVRRVAAGESLPRHDGVAIDPRLASLTPQERRILALVGAGMTNRQIGDEVALAEKTVKNYVSSILAKLGFERRTQAAVFAVTHGGLPGWCP